MLAAFSLMDERTTQPINSAGPMQPGPGHDYTEEARLLLRAILPRFDSLPYRDQRFIEGWQRQLAGDPAPVNICRFASLSELAAKLGIIAPEVARERASACRAIIGQGGEV